jgi:hypothetical protein
MKRPYTKEEKALLDEMSRSTDPRQEAQQQLEYELEHGCAHHPARLHRRAPARCAATAT